MRTELPLAAFMMAAQRQRPAESLICQSDRGSPMLRAFRDKLVAAGKPKLVAITRDRPPQRHRQEPTTMERPKR